MRIAVFGATGGTGRQIVEQALAAGNAVSVLVRDRTKLNITGALLSVVDGNVLNADDVAKTVQGADAVIVSLGNTANNPDMVVSQGTALIVQAMQKLGVRRLVVVSSLGVGDSKPQVPFVFRMLMSTILRKVMQDKEAQEAIVRTSGLEWTIVRPGGLTDAPRTGSCRAGTDPSIGAGRVSRADVAEFVLLQLRDSQYIGKTPAIC